MQLHMLKRLSSASLRSRAEVEGSLLACQEANFCTVTACYRRNVSVLQRRQGTVRFKTKAGGVQSREALLETKTHRRVNRRQVGRQCCCVLCEVHELWHKKQAGTLITFVTRQLRHVL